MTEVFMAYIYIITNKINNKSYIGKTEHTNPNKRWNEHCKDYKKEYYKNRPLYRAFNKYGLDNFEFKVLLETNTPEEDEIRLIKEYDTYSKGYNATLGGDGKKLITSEKEQEIINFYLINKKLLNKKDIKNHFNISIETLNNIFKKHNIIFESKPVEYNNLKPVYQYDKQNNFIQKFESVREAMRAMKISNGRISACCNGKLKTTCGYIWKWHNSTDSNCDFKVLET